MKTVCAVFLVSLFSLAVMACGGKKSSEPTCDNAAKHLSKLMKKAFAKQLEELPEKQRAGAEKMEKEFSEADAMAKKCKRDKVPKETLECMLAANGMEDLEKCDFGKKKGTAGGEKDKAPGM
jgi:hypothetical protein